MINCPLCYSFLLVCNSNDECNYLIHLEETSAKTGCSINYRITFFVRLYKVQKKNYNIFMKNF